MPPDQLSLHTGFKGGSATLGQLSDQLSSESHP